jgi:hypothetical protein
MTTRIIKPDNSPVDLPLNANTAGDLRKGYLFKNLPFASVTGAEMAIKRYTGSGAIVFEASTDDGLINLSEFEDDLVVSLSNDAELPVVVGTWTLVLIYTDGTREVFIQSTATFNAGAVPYGGL